VNRSSTPAGGLRDTGWHCTLAATALIAIVVGSRSAFGLFLSPINSATGLGLATIGFAAALGQVGQGVAQPLVGALADRHGASRVITAGVAGFALATALLPAAADAFVLATLILLGGIAGTAMSSIAMMVGEVARRVPASRQGLAIGIVGAGGSAGQLLFGPMTQATIASAGWHAALWVTAAIALLALPLSLVFRRPAGTGAEPAPAVVAGGAGTRPQGASALRQPAFWLIGGGFAVCGFHMSFLTMHMPGFIERCGLPSSLAGAWLALLGVTNIAGSLAIGVLLKRCQPASLLLMLHGLRAFFIAGLLALPATAPVMLAFAIAMGATYMAALPATTMLVTQTFGAHRLATLFGLVMLLHQLGSFAGVWLGGLAAESLAGYRAIWLVDLGLAVLAAALHLPFRRPSSPLAALPTVPARPA
jgi:MFS family permease